jgi:hypothetical protein
VRKNKKDIGKMQQKADTLRFSKKFSKNGYFGKESNFGNFRENNKLSKDAQIEYNILFPKKNEEGDKSLDISQISRNISRFRESQSQTKNSKNENNFGEISKNKGKKTKKFYFNKNEMRAYSNRLVKKPKTMNLVRKHAKEMNLYRNYIPNKNKRFSGKTSKLSSSQIGIIKNKKKEINKLSDKKLNDILHSIKSARNSHYKINKTEKIYSTFTGLEKNLF